MGTGDDSHRILRRYFITRGYWLTIMTLRAQPTQRAPRFILSRHSALCKSRRITPRAVESIIEAERAAPRHASRFTVGLRNRHVQAVYQGRHRPDCIGMLVRREASLACQTVT